MSELLETPMPADLFITDELHRRPPRRTDYLQEKCALQDLARQMVDHPADVLARLVDLAMEITGATSGGISLFEETPSASVFRWHYVRGGLERFEGATTPRNFSPCGITLDRGESTLTRHPERYYSWIADAGITCPEVLLVPLYIASTLPLGTLWVVADKQGFFDNGHARVLAELAGFAGIALRMLQTEQRLKEALEQQEMLTKEMSHRVKNLFAVADGMIKVSARSAATPKDMGEILSGRLHALADANALVRRSFGHAMASVQGTELAEVVRKILRPHAGVEKLPREDRFNLDGPPISLGEHATNGFALVCHELATNAAKYGALTNDDGFVRVSWFESAEWLKVIWQERGGPVIESAPAKVGFGSTLAKHTIVGQFNGTLCYDWQPEGLTVSISVPIKVLLR